MGAEITGIDLKKHFNRSANRIDSAVMADIKAVWLERQLIVIRQQSITPEQQLRFAESLGEPDIYPFLQGLDGFPMITEVLKKETETVNFGGVWHSDTTYQSCPPMATVLYAKELPPIGGDTLFSNQYAAYEQLSDGLKRTIGPLRGVNIAGKKRVSATRSERVKESGSGIKAEQMIGIHPVVRTHPDTGRKSLFVNPAHTVSFDGWTESESAGLLAFLFAHQIAPEFQCRLSWQVGDIAIWDNRCTLHYPLNDYHGYRRLLHRITLKGEKPV
ncbi:MAG: alpha-ketoglutarate-dependent taurine dioxygenase [Alphaproteobacteria bacterium]|nr:MAG: alpha-ketoglutarate-dependent taurine dioxygenase [Alphaproteobacteria bacterium]